MLKIDPVIVDYNAITSYGEGTEVCWQGLFDKQTAISDIDRFDTKNFTSNKAATIKGLVRKSGKSLVLQMLERLQGNVHKGIPKDTDLMVASLNGEIDFVEEDVFASSCSVEESCLDVLLKKTHDLFDVRGSGMIISAACASSSIAIARAASLIKLGKSDCILIVACDCVSEFIVSGFSALRALDSQCARPFDKKREGINIGEAAAYVLLMSRERAEKEKRNIKGKMLGWGMSCDANHMTGPSIEGEGLYLSIKRALELGEVSKEKIASICAHGTGTVYNDAMEIKAFKRIFKERSCPAYSIKGGIGHTMGAAGIMDMIIATETIKNNVLPPTVGTKEIEDQAEFWISREKVELKNDIVLSTNSGFGGINSALVIAADY